MSDALTILNVNDDEATRYLYSNILKRAGHKVLEAATGRDALELARAERPHLVLLDIRLPDISGLEVCRQLKVDPALRGVLVLQTSATFASSDRKVAGLDSGADAYLASPLEGVELLATIRALVRRRQAEEEQRRTARKLQKTFDAIQDPLFMVDTAGVVGQCNHAAYALLEVNAGADVVGRRADDLLHPFVHREALRTVLECEGGVRQEIEVEGNGRFYRISVDPIAGDAGGPEGSVLLVRDITDRRHLADEHKKRAEELAVEARRKDEFLGMLAHELRNPLNAISAANSILDKVGGHDANSVRLRSVISRQTRHLARMVDDLLEMSRFTRGKIQLRRQPTDLVQVVRQAIHATQTTLEARRQQLAITLPAEPVMVDGDEVRLEQVVANLLNNASKYSEPNRTIRVALALAAGGHAQLDVIDEGVGVPGHMLEAIFEPFVQVDPTLARSLGGLGIGLSIAKSLVEMHGGHVTATSDGVGKGTELRVVLPATKAPARTAPAVGDGDAAAQAMRPMRPLRIIVVEDNADTRELLETWLGMLGHEVRTAPDGRAGLDLLAETRPDLAFLDIGLPVMDGYELAKNIRAGGHRTYLVALTGYGRPEDRDRALGAGFDDFIVKPLDQAALERVLKKPSQEPSGAREGSEERASAS